MPEINDTMATQGDSKDRSKQDQRSSSSRSSKQRGGAGRGQGRKKLFPGSTRTERIPVAAEIRDSATRLLQELWNQGLIVNTSKVEDLLAVLQMQSLVVFDDVAIPASFGFTETEVNQAETFNIIHDVFESRKSGPQNQLVGVRVKGDSMDRAGIFPDDLLIVEFFTEFGVPEDGEIVVAYVDDSPTIKRYMRQPDGKIVLMPESSNPEHLRDLPGPLTSDRCQVVGVVRYVIHDLKNPSYFR